MRSLRREMDPTVARTPVSRSANGRGRDAIFLSVRHASGGSPPAADVGATHAGRRLRLGAQALAELAVHVFDIWDVIDEQRRGEEGESVHGISIFESVKI